MTRQHTRHHNDAFTLSGAYHNNHHFEAVVDERNLKIDDVQIVPIPWKQIHRANVPHLVRHSGT
ncbi:MAG: hypothetical protein K6T83_21365 [Alicyclobacillus sp.]|nr:hypothetical protein [Alicyclobacillus sp.]